MAKGSVRKKGKKWYYRFYVEDASGNPVQKEYAGTESKSETEKLLRKAMEDYESKKFIAKSENITVGELLDMWAEEELKVGTLSNGTVENSDLYIFYHTFIFPTNIFSSPPLRKLIFGHYISSFPPSYHTSSGITQITFLNAHSKFPYKQMQSLTRNNHITSNHLSSLALIPSKHISAITFLIQPPFHAHL